VDEKRFDELAITVAGAGELEYQAAEGMSPGFKTDAANEERLPRRLAALGLAGGLAALASVLRGKTNEASAHPGQKGLFIKTRIITDSANVPNNSNRVLRMVCPNASGQTVRVLGGGFNTTTNNPNFYIKTSAPDSNRSWLVDAHNVGSGATRTVGGYAVCAYFHA
jgi:hypothetical protein